MEVYDAAIKAAALEGNSGQAETILRVMVDMGVTPGSETIRRGPGSRFDCLIGDRSR